MAAIQKHTVAHLKHELLLWYHRTTSMSSLNLENTYDVEESLWYRVCNKEESPYFLVFTSYSLCTWRYHWFFKDTRGMICVASWFRYTQLCRQNILTEADVVRLPMFLIKRDKSFFCAIWAFLNFWGNLPKQNNYKFLKALCLVVFQYNRCAGQKSHIIVWVGTAIHWAVLFTSRKCIFVDFNFLFQILYSEYAGPGQQSNEGRT